MARGDDPNSGSRTLTGKAALGDWTTDAPGVRRKVTLDDLAQPFATPSVENHLHIVSRPAEAWPKAPQGFEVTEFATQLVEPRVIVRAPSPQKRSISEKLKPFLGSPSNDRFLGLGSRPIPVAFASVGHIVRRTEAANVGDRGRCYFRTAVR